MGEWLTVPGAEQVIAERIARFSIRRNGCRRAGRRYRYSMETLVYFDESDVADLADVSEVPLWDCEMPWTDDGF